MRRRTRRSKRDEEAAIRCLAHGIAHVRAEFGEQRLATILGTIALDLAAPADPNPVADPTVVSDQEIPPVLDGCTHR